jgi:hypothetical protein
MSTRWPTRRPPQAEAPPEKLCRFVESEWRGGWPDGLAEWRAAALAWLKADPARRLPFGQRGDLIDLLRESRRIRMARAGDD